MKLRLKRKGERKFRPIPNNFYWLRISVDTPYEIGRYSTDGKFYLTGQEKGYYASVFHDYVDIPLNVKEAKWDSKYLSLT